MAYEIQTSVSLVESDAAPVVKEKELPVPGEEVAAEEISAPMEEAAAVLATSPVEELPAPIEESATGKEEPIVVTEEAREAPSEEEKITDVVPDEEKAGAPGALDDEATPVSRKRRMCPRLRRRKWLHPCRRS